MAERNTVWALTIALLAAAALAAPLGIMGAMPAVANSSKAVAKVGGEIITSEELERGVSAELVSLEQRRQVLLRRKLDLLIQQHLFAQEAKRRSLTVEQLLAKEI